MAAAYLHALAGGRYDARSAGTAPADHPHPEVVAVMAEDGIVLDDIAGTLLTTELAEQAVRVIGMGCAVEAACPALRVPLEDWKLDDPKGQPLDAVRAIRDDVRGRVQTLIAELDAAS
jgi:arsenate reductase